MNRFFLLLIILNIHFIVYSQIPHVQGEKKYCPGDEIELRAYGDTSFAWANANYPDSILSTSNHFTDSPQELPAYYLYTAEDTLLIEFYDGAATCYCHYYIPNHFTPDGDEYNHTFKPIVNCEHFAMRLTIYSREQLIVFDETDYDVSWDGMNQITGELMATGIYPYIFSFITDLGDKVTVEGFVFLAK